MTPLPPSRARDRAVPPELDALVMQMWRRREDRPIDA